MDIRGAIMQTQIKSWGNSQGIRLNKQILEDAGFKQDDILDITIASGQIILSKPFRHRSLKERAAEYGGKLNLDGEYDWGEPVGREMW